MYVSLLDRWFVIKEMSHLSPKKKRKRKKLYILKNKIKNIKFTSLFQSVRKVTHNNMIVWISVPPIIPDHIPCYISIYIHIPYIFSISKSNCFPIKHYFANSILIRFLYFQAITWGMVQCTLTPKSNLKPITHPNGIPIK